MVFSTRIVWDMETLQIIERDTFEYNGPVDKFCGATTAQKTAQANELSTADQMEADFHQIFGDNENILKSVTGALTPVVEAGPDQYGFSPAEDTALRTQATAENAAAGQRATNALRSSLASEGGGNMVLPNGSTAALEASQAESEAQTQANNQLAITEKGYDTGRQNFFASEGALAGAPGELENPATAAGSAAEGANQVAMGGATDIANANNAWIAPVGGLIGGVGEAAINRGKSS